MGPLGGEYERQLMVLLPPRPPPSRPWLHFGGYGLGLRVLLLLLRPLPLGLPGIGWDGLYCCGLLDCDQASYCPPTNQPSNQPTQGGFKHQGCIRAHTSRHTAAMKPAFVAMTSSMLLEFTP